MHNNGVSHAVTADDFEGVLVMLNWLSYMPKVCLIDYILIDYTNVSHLLHLSMCRADFSFHLLSVTLNVRLLHKLLQTMYRNHVIIILTLYGALIRT